MKTLDIEKIKNRVDKQVPQIKLKDLDAVSLWPSMFRAVTLKSPKKLLSDFGIEPPEGAVFLGEPGNGRHTAAEALAGSKCNPEAKEYHHYLRITGWDFDCETAEEACCVAEYAAEAAKEYEHFCLFIDSPEESKFGKHFQYRLAEKLRELENNIFVIIVTDEMESLCRELVKNFKICRCVPPTQKQREKWIEGCMEKPFVGIEEMSHLELAEKTEGFNWQQMNNMLNYMREVLVWKYYKMFKENRDLKLLGEAVKTGGASLTKDEAQRIINSVMGKKTVPVISGFAGALPGVIPAMNSPQESNVNKTMDEDSVIAAMKKEIEIQSHPEKMTPDQLLNLEF